MLIGGLEQCVCGIYFLEGFVDDPEYCEHLINGTHDRCMAIEVCGPCFFGYCKGCDGTRRSEKQHWRCRCMHDFPLSFHNYTNIEFLWSDWLQFGRRGSVSIGIEVPAWDASNPIQGENK